MLRALKNSVLPQVLELVGGMVVPNDISRFWSDEDNNFIRDNAIKTGAGVII